MEKKQALEILNSFEIVDVDSDGECILNIYVENNEENKHKIMRLGFSENDLLGTTFDFNATNDVIDLNFFAWDFAGWFEENTFFEKNPNQLPRKKCEVVNRIGSREAFQIFIRHHLQVMNEEKYTDLSKEEVENIADWLEHDMAFYESLSELLVEYIRDFHVDID